MTQPDLQDIDLSICIVSWRVKEQLRACLNSIRRASPDLSYEVLVVDNDSRDGSGAMVKDDFPEVILIGNRVNRGFAAACNQAIGRSRGRYLLLLNPDTRVRDGSLEEMVRFLDRHPAAGGAGPKLLNPDGSLQLSIRAFPTFRSSLGQFTILGDLGLFRRVIRKYLMKDFDYERASIVEQPMGAALFLRRAALADVGVLDESFFLYFEEVDLCRRLSGAGRPIWYNPAAAVIHIGGISTGQAGSRAVLWFFQSQFRYFSKEFGPDATARFKAIFKPLFLLGFYWSIIQNTASLLRAYLVGEPPGEKERKENRLRQRWRFLTEYLLDFLLL